MAHAVVSRQDSSERDEAISVSSGMAAGIMAALQANNLPNPVVEVGTSSHQRYSVAAARALQARFPTQAPVTFHQLPPDAHLQVSVMFPSQP